MRLDRVTITGADDSVRPGDLFALSRRYPFVEWGILIRPHGCGPRYPSAPWVFDLNCMAVRNTMRLSLHVCGAYVRHLLIGDNTFPYWMADCCQRVQLNFRPERNTCYPDKFLSALEELQCERRRQFIFQIDGTRGNRHMESVMGDVDAVPLFDISGGRGIVPGKWPEPRYSNGYEPIYHGYAGGLGPENLAEELPKIAAAVGNCRIWIDMETRVRSADDRIFDLEKAERCLEIARPFVQP